jgi:hypothetical protein
MAHSQAEHRALEIQRHIIATSKFCFIRRRRWWFVVMEGHVLIIGKNNGRLYIDLCCFEVLTYFSRSW